MLVPDVYVLLGVALNVLAILCTHKTYMQADSAHLKSSLTFYNCFIILHLFNFLCYSIYLQKFYKTIVCNTMHLSAKWQNHMGHLYGIKMNSLLG